jgi:hypothetical protein
MAAWLNNLPAHPTYRHAFGVPDCSRYPIDRETASAEHQLKSLGDDASVCPNGCPHESVAAAPDRGRQMTEHNENPKDSSTDAPNDEHAPVELDDAFEAEEHDKEDSIPGETPEDFDPGTRAVTDEASTASVPPTAPAMSTPTAYARRKSTSPDDDMGDAAGLPTTEEPVETTRGEINWDRELSTQRIAIELRRIETEVRRLLEDKDPKRKRRLAGTRRWFELEEDIIALSYSGRIDQETLLELQNLVIRRHHLFRRLRFLASTRPTWNS